MDCPSRRVLCRQFGQRFQAKSQTQFEENEDCLHLNIYVPVVSAWNVPQLRYAFRTRAEAVQWTEWHTGCLLA